VYSSSVFESLLSVLATDSLDSVKEDVTEMGERFLSIRFELLNGHRRFDGVKLRNLFFG
jgi:hypothetical protein